MDRTRDLSAVVPALVRLVPGVVQIELRGSRQRGEAGRFSDWDFVVRTEDFAATAVELPAAFGPLEPLALQWDRLSDEACFMIILPGPVKIDLIFDEVPHVHEPPWTVSASTMAGIDAHFWDWTLWLASKVDAGKTELVQSELMKMHDHLLGPLGLRSPTSLSEAVDSYLEARTRWVRRLRISVDRSLEEAAMVTLNQLRP